MVQTSTLVKIAAFGGLALGGTGYALRGIMKSQFANSDLHKSAMKTLRAHPGAVMLLGEPIVSKSIEIDYEKNFCDGENAKYEVPIRGPKDRGYYYLWATLVKDKWVVTRAELAVDKEPSRRLIIVKDVTSSYMLKTEENKLNISGNEIQ